MSYSIHGIPAADDLLGELAYAGPAMSAISYMEAVQSIARSPIPATARQRFDGLLSEIPVIPFGLAEADRTAALFEQLRRERKRVRSRALDLLIAGTALHHGLTLVSNNAADYRDIPDLMFRAADIGSGSS